jgi:hypothetical protein
MATRLVLNELYLNLATLAAGLLIVIVIVVLRNSAAFGTSGLCQAVALVMDRRGLSIVLGDICGGRHFGYCGFKRVERKMVLSIFPVWSMDAKG